jgi:hypothetical protein
MFPQRPQDGEATNSSSDEPSIDEWCPIDFERAFQHVANLSDDFLAPNPRYGDNAGVLLAAFNTTVEGQ